MDAHESATTPFHSLSSAKSVPKGDQEQHHLSNCPATRNYSVDRSMKYTGKPSGCVPPSSGWAEVPLAPTPYLVSPAYLLTLARRLVTKASKRPQGSTRTAWLDSVHLQHHRRATLNPFPVFSPRPVPAVLAVCPVW